MKQLTVDTLKAACLKNGYKWYTDRPHIIEIRTALTVADIFNDFLCLVYPVGGSLAIKTYPCTTEPGAYYQKHLLNPKGCAVKKPGQNVNAYMLDYHKGNKDHRALIQVKPITVIRDKDLDGIAGNSGTDDTGLFGANIHGEREDIRVAPEKQAIGPWSAGCTVLPVWKHKEEMVDICEMFKIQTLNRYTETILLESDL